MKAVSGKKVWNSAKKLMEEAMLDPDLVNTMVGYLRNEGFQEEIWIRRCLRCDKLFPARGKYIRSCNLCRHRDDVIRDRSGGQL